MPRTIHLPIALSLFLLNSVVFASSLQVTSASNSGAGTLRTAIETSNSNGVADTITFASALMGKVIRPLTPLPPLTEGGLTIDGDTNADGKPDITLKGSVAGGRGLDVKSANNLVRNLVISLFQTGIAIRGYQAIGNAVTGCYVGTDPTASWSLANDFGIVVAEDAGANTIGGTVAANRNIVSGNAGGGIVILNANSVKIIGNYIGTDLSGSAVLSNGAGVLIYDSASCSVGNGSTAGRNLISGNVLQDGTLTVQSALLPAVSAVPVPDRGAGIVIHRGTKHVISGNQIGTDAVGAKPLRNSGGGIVVVNATSVTIGGTSTGARNTVSGNQWNAGISATSCRGLKITGNYIGLNRAGTAALGNGAGVELFTCFGALVGGTTATARNVISGNRGSGVSVDGGDSNSVLGNYIGVAALGSARAPNGIGVHVQAGAAGTAIGNATAGSGNVISGNTKDGVRIDSYATDGTVVTRNLIGLDATGTVALPNISAAIEVTDDAGPVTIGGASAALGNTIQVRAYEAGILLTSRNLSGTTVQHNKIAGPSDALRCDLGISVAMPAAGEFDGALARNSIRFCRQGLYTSGAFALPVVTANTFDYCTDAVFTENSSNPDLGNLQDAIATNNGGNTFVRANLTRAIRNNSNKNLMAEGNDWGTTSTAVIEALIMDELDDTLLVGWGRVDYSPLAGGVTPTAIARQALQLNSVCSAPTRTGAQIVFALSTEASVGADILNLSGRVVARLTAQTRPAGLNSLSWSRSTLTNTRAPSGLYLVKLTARSANGDAASQMASLRLER